MEKQVKKIKDLNKDKRNFKASLSNIIQNDVKGNSDIEKDYNLALK